MASRPRRHSVVTLRLTVTPDECDDDEFRRDSSISPTPSGRPRFHSRARHGRPFHAPLCRTPTSPLCRSPSSPMTRSPTHSRAPTPTSPLPRTPTSPHSPPQGMQSPRRDSVSPMSSSPLPGRKSPSAMSPRLFRYDSSSVDPKNLRRRSSLLTVPSAYESTSYVMHEHLHNRLPRQRSSSIAGPLRTPDLLRYLHESSDMEKILGPASSNSSMSSDGGEPGGSVSPSLGRRGILPSHEYSSSYTNHGVQRRRHSNAIDSSVFGITRCRQFSTTPRGVVVNKGDSIRPRRSTSNTSVTSTMSSQSRVPSIDSNTPTPAGSRGPSPPCSRSVTPVPTPTPPPQFSVAMVGSPGVGRTSLVTQFMTSEYMCAYDDSSDETGSERTVSVLLDGEEAELIFIRYPDDKKNSISIEDPNFLTESAPLSRGSSGSVDAWVVVYSVSDRNSFRDAASVLGRIWSKGWVSIKAVILVANKTDLERTRVISVTEGRTLARTYECKFIEVSAGLDHHVDELLVGILAQIRLKMKCKEESQRKSPETRITKRSLSDKFKHRSSFRMKGFLSKVLSKGNRSQSCENLHML